MESRAGFLGGGVWSHGRVALPPRIATASQRAGPWAAGAVQPPSFVFFLFPVLLPVCVKPWRFGSLTQSGCCVGGAQGQRGAGDPFVRTKAAFS